MSIVGQSSIRVNFHRGGREKWRLACFSARLRAKRPAAAKPSHSGRALPPFLQDRTLSLSDRGHLEADRAQGVADDGFSAPRPDRPEADFGSLEPDRRTAEDDSGQRLPD